MQSYSQAECWKKKKNNNKWKFLSRGGYSNEVSGAGEGCVPWFVYMFRNGQNAESMLGLKTYWDVLIGQDFRGTLMDGWLGFLQKKNSIATFTRKIFQILSLSAQYTMHFMKKRRSTNWIHLKAHNIFYKMQASTITYMSSSTMTLIFSQPSGGSRPNEYDLFGRGLATTLKWESGVSDSHPSISG